MSLSGRQTSAGARPARRKLANALRALAMDAVEAASSGHPGMPMGMADIAEVLWNDFLRFSPVQPEWDNRDRFVLSNGHGSMLLYAIAFLTGYPIGLDELKRFRQLGSRTAGHPEREPSIGIETTTGPLGQGVANAVGLAIAERALAAEFNRPGYPIVDHRTYVFLGDGCMMEGISHEACSLAGTLGLGKLIAIYDDNGISIDGPTQGWFTDDTPARFAAYGWHVIADVDGHDSDAVAAALREALANTDQPSLLCCKTIIGFGAPNRQGTAATHGAPLGADEVAAARQALGWTHAPFEIPPDLRAAWDARARGAALHAKWSELLEAYRGAYPELAAEYVRRMSGALPSGWAAHASDSIGAIAAEAKSMATRQASQRALEAFSPVLPELIGGSADLTGSNNTKLKQSVTITRESPGGNYLYYGVREFGMAATMNGLALHGGLIPYGGTFLVFSDYARNALRLAAMMRIRSILVLTHDSIGLGEDGPTHQPIEHLAGLRAMPNMDVWRPCDGTETAVAWRAAIERRDGPTALVLTRQSVPHVDRTRDQIDAIEKGGYVLRNTAEQPELILLATGSEVALALAGFERLRDEHAVRVVSMPCVERFEAQEASYRRHVLPRGVPVVAIEAASPDPWWRFVGEGGAIIGMRSFGASAPGKILFEHFGFTADAVVDTARELLRGRARELQAKS